jgi:hypothetical protein
MIWLLAQGRPAEQVAAVTGDTAHWVRASAQHYNRQGPAGFGGRRHRNRGSRGRFSAVQRTALARTLDRHRLGLKSGRRRVWCRRGDRAHAVVQHRSQWCYRYAFVHPPSGRTFWWLLPTVSGIPCNMALAECAHAVGAGRGKPSMLVGDGAG